MVKVIRFEDLICGQKALKLVNIVYKTITIDACKNDYRYQNQIIAAAVSAMTIIAEGFKRFHKKSFIRFLDISQSSSAEVQSLLYVAIDQQYINRIAFNKIYKIAEETIKLILDLIKYLNSKLEYQTNTLKEPEFEYQPQNSEYWELPNEFINKNSNTVTQ